MALAECMYTRPGGWIIKNWIFPGVIILNMVADLVCHLYGFQWGIENLNGTYKIKGKQKEAAAMALH